MQASGVSEGAEEMLESILQPFLEKLTYNEAAETVLDDPKLWGDAAASFCNGVRRKYRGLFTIYLHLCHDLF